MKKLPSNWSTLSWTSKMNTRTSEEKMRERKRVYSQEYCKREGKKEEGRKKAQENRERKRIMKSVLSDRLLLSQEKIEELKNALKKKDVLYLESLDDHEAVQESSEEIGNQPAEEAEDEEEPEKNIFLEMVTLCKSYASNKAACKGLFSMKPHKFDSFVTECIPALNCMIYRRTQQIKPNSSTLIPHHSFIFLTFFWLHHYLTFKVLSHLFNINPQSCTRVLKRITVALAKVLENDIQFLSDEEMNNLCDSEFQNLGFS